MITADFGHDLGDLSLWFPLVMRLSGAWFDLYDTVSHAHKGRQETT
jgi:hypothetical protein